MNMPAFCTTVIPTVGRPSLARAVQSVLDARLTGDGAEIVVVNDTGRALSETPWQGHEGVRIITTDRRERCVARNAGAQVASGRYLHFLDDDDAVLPGGLEALQRRAMEQPDAHWVFGSWQIVDNDHRVLREFHPGLAGNIFAHVVAGESMPLQASLVRADAFRAAGAFDDSLRGVEDRDLGRRLALRGSAAWEDTVVASVRVGQDGSTTDWRHLGEDDRRGREKVLDAAEASERLRASSSSPEVAGRVSRAYAASAAWNVEHHNLGKAVRRASAAGAVAIRYFHVPAFWRGVATPNP